LKNIQYWKVHARQPGARVSAIFPNGAVGSVGNYVTSSFALYGPSAAPPNNTKNAPLKTALPTTAVVTNFHKLLPFTLQTYLNIWLNEQLERTISL
jgi:hypothetical protein